MKLLKLNSKNLLRYPSIIEQISRMSNDLTKSDTRYERAAGVKRSDKCKTPEKHWNVGDILCGRRTAYVLCGSGMSDHKQHVVAMLLVNDDYGYSNAVRVSYVYVEPEYRRKGVGKELFDKFLSTIPETTTVFLSCYEDNLGAMDFYESVGFHRFRALLLNKGTKKAKK